MNSMLSRLEQSEHKTWEGMAMSIKELVASKYEDLIRAVHGSGERQFIPQYARLQLTPVQLNNMNKAEHTEHLQKVFKFGNVIWNFAFL